MRHGDQFSPAVIERIAGLLDEFGTGDELTLSELSERTDLPRSSVHRLLSQLVEAGWVERRGNRYFLSRTMIGWGARAQQTDSLYRAAHPVLHELHASTGLVAHLGVLEGPDVRYLDKVGRTSVTVPTRIGGRQPAMRTALGRALIAHAGPTRNAELLERVVGTNVVARQLIALARRDHVAHETEQAAPGVACVAAPVGDRHGAVAAISLTGPVADVDPIALTPPLRAAARSVWATLEGEHRESGQRTSA